MKGLRKNSEKIFATYDKEPFSLNLEKAPSSEAVTVVPTRQKQQQGPGLLSQGHQVAVVEPSFGPRQSDSRIPSHCVWTSPLKRKVGILC